jgi:hypothetical protein
LNLPNTEKLVSNLLEWIILRVEMTTVENIALRKMLASRGIGPKQLRKELAEVQGTSSVKKRAHAESVRLEKAALQWIRLSEKEESLERLPVKGRVQ